MVVREVAEVGRTHCPALTDYVQTESSAIMAGKAMANFGLIRDLAR